MRLHALRISAFGPYAGTEEVDFDRLNEAGIFLLHGATGAGKTSILDAVSFAIFGTVPGTRGPAGRLRSDHSPAELPTEVSLELTVRGRRLRFTRSPAWERPKRRGTGTTKEQPRVLLEEIECGGRRVLSTRLDETGHFVRSLFGMTAEQFCQVVLLPQGRFADFLRADAEARRVLLEQLFATQRFSAAETYLADQRRGAAREVDAAGLELGTVLARMGQAAGVPQEHVPAADGVATAHASGDTPGDATGSASASASALPAPWAAQLLAEALAMADEARAGENAAATEHTRARLAHEAACDLAGRQARLAEARATKAALDAACDDVTELAQALDDGRRAAALRPLLSALVTADKKYQSATAHEATLRARLPATIPAGEARSRAQIRRSLATVSADAQRLADLEDDEIADQDATAAEAALADERQRCLTDAAKAEQDAVKLGDALATAEKAERIAEQAAATLPQLEVAVRSAQARAVAALRRDAARQEVAVHDAAHRAAVDQAQAEKARWLELRQLRLEGMAAELAATLRPGDECPVCGAVEHAVTARAAQRPADDLAAREAAAEAASVAAEDRRRTASDALATARTALATASAVALDGDAADLAEVVTRTVAQREALAAQAAKLPERQEARKVAADALTDARLVEETCRVRAAECEAELRHVREDVLKRRRRLARARGDDASVQSRRERLTATVMSLERLLAAAESTEGAKAAARSAEKSAAEAAKQAGFASLEAAQAAVVDDAALRAWAEQLRAVQDQEAQVSAVLSDPGMQEAAVAPPADVAGTAARLAEAEQVRIDAGSARARAEASAVQLEHLTVELDARLREFEPLAARLRRIDRLSRLAEGSGPDNALRMRLSAFVLAARLEQVAAAATSRLLRMTSGRYSLSHCDEGLTGRGRAGLGLRVVDAWTGCARDPATLSGGETFTASLALALGLADVATAEAGGILIDTLLVDEGFGSLDDESLEEVLEVLDGLREGGRVVGLVSHVAELRSRIPVQLWVVKGRSGSSIVQDRTSGASVFGSSAVAGVSAVA